MEHIEKDEETVKRREEKKDVRSSEKHLLARWQKEKEKKCECAIPYETHSQHNISDHHHPVWDFTADN